MASAETVLLARDDRIAVVTINRPEAMNALNDETISSLGNIFGDLEQDDSVLGVVLTSTGGALAGADIKELAALTSHEDTSAVSVKGQKVFAQTGAMPKPVIAAIDGPVLGGGAELCMACDARVVGEKLLYGQPEVNLGIIPGYGATQRLPRLIDTLRAVELLRTGKPIKSEEACLLGWGFPAGDDDIVTSAKALILALLDGAADFIEIDPSPVALPDELPDLELGHLSRAIDAIMVDVLERGLALPLEAGLLVEADAFGLARMTRDCEIGMRNFLENGPRTPAVFVHE